LRSNTTAFRLSLARKASGFGFYSRPGNDLTYGFPLIAEGLLQLRSRSCIIDGEAGSCGADGIASFNRIRYRRHDGERR
jgi:ATP-dependent DNA ligase